MTEQDIDEFRDQLRTALGEVPESRIDGLSQVLLRIAKTDPDTNVVMGNIPAGEAEDYACMVAFAEATHSPIMLRVANLTMMGKRGERGHLLGKLLEAVKAIGKGLGDAPRGFLGRMKG